MIDLGRIAGLYTHGHQLHAYCQRCDRWRVLDLAQLILEGKGERRLPITVRCHRCGEVGQLQVRPPMADWTGVLSTWGGQPGVVAAGPLSSAPMRQSASPER